MDAAAPPATDLPGTVRHLAGVLWYDMLSEMNKSGLDAATLGAGGDEFQSLFMWNIAQNDFAGYDRQLTDAALRQLGAAASRQDVPATPAMLPAAPATPAASSTMTAAMSLAAAPEAALTPGLAPSGLAASAADFARAVWPGLVQAAAALGVPPAGLLAQAALETKWGTAAPGNNLFGIKASPGQPATWQPTHEMQAGVMVPTLAAFRSYASVQDSIADYVREIRASFPQAVGQSSVAGFAQALAAGGYATDRAYAAKILNLAHSPLMAAALAAVAAPPNKETSK